MKTRIFRCHFSFLLFVLILSEWVQSASSFAFTLTSDLPESKKLSNPFLLPQTGFFIGRSSYTIRTKNSMYKTSSYLDNGKINTYGFDIEVNSTSFLNIGSYFRFTYQSVGLREVLPFQFQTSVGGFTRFFYSPSFLHSKSTISNLFVRLDFGGGPAVYGRAAGVLFQTGVHFGIETYISKWLGIGLSYGRLFELGKDTAIGGNKDISEQVPQTASATLANQAEVFMVTLKTTLF